MVRLQNFLFFIAISVCTLLSSGCTPRVVVRAHPGPHDNGIRYYRPKPYLKIEPAEVAVDKTRTELVPGMYRVSLVYMPDFSEEYALDVKTGFGTANVGIKLQDGWNLTEINQNLDSQTDENVKAIASLVDAIGPLATAADNDQQSKKQVSFTVSGRNVPIGFYESMIGRDPAGCKRLYGFRYLGFVPFSACPIDVGGRGQACCGDGQYPLYGLTFHDNLMQFEPLDVMATTADLSSINGNDTASAKTSTSILPSPQTVPPTSPTQLSQVEVRLRNVLLQVQPQLGQVLAELRDGVVLIQLESPRDLPSLPLQLAAEDWLFETYGNKARFIVQIVAI